jgi:ring-1,2-phenylacetyl-CoA epoxidase subunit PaaB
MQLKEAEGLYHPYEVFVQYDHLAHHQHVGSVLAASPDIALQLARENFLRRDKAVNIWVVRKGQRVRQRLSPRRRILGQRAALEGV